MCSTQSDGHRRALPWLEQLPWTFVLSRWTKRQELSPCRWTGLFYQSFILFRWTYHQELLPCAGGHDVRRAVPLALGVQYPNWRRAIPIWFVWACNTLEFSLGVHYLACCSMACSTICWCRSLFCTGVSTWSVDVTQNVHWNGRKYMGVLTG